MKKLNLTDFRIIFLNCITYSNPISIVKILHQIKEEKKREILIEKVPDSQIKKYKF